MKNPIIVNPDANPELASYLADIVKDFTSSFPCTRDNCAHINRELMTQLIMEGETPKLIYGLYRVDSYLGWLDEDDFTDEELARYEQQGRASILKSVPELGIEERTRQSAARTLVPIITQLGFDEQDITITFRKGILI